MYPTPLVITTVVFPDVTSFVINQQGRRDATFFLCGEVCRFVSKLCARCYMPETIPLENSWFPLLGFKVSEGKFMSEEDFLVRHRLTNRIATASKQSAEVTHLNKKWRRLLSRRQLQKRPAALSKMRCNSFNIWSNKSSVKLV